MGQNAGSKKLMFKSNISYRIAENIGKFNCLDHLEEKTLVNGFQIKYGY